MKVQLIAAIRKWIEDVRPPQSQQDDLIDNLLEDLGMVLDEFETE